jgi:serine/threonine protein kinase/tetratricopeptide (TPR) repeat protein
MPADPNRVRDLFLAAAALPPAARPSYLAGECGPDADLRAEVERLLAAHDRPASVLEPRVGVPAREPPTGPLAPEPPPGTESFRGRDETPGAVLAGRYKLVEEVGEGGMGSVWMAQQTEPVRRLVAVKLIKPGMDSRAVLARFDAERQALALMDHPNIAKVLDAGATPDGRPFFVMELVKGVPITRFCDDRRLTPRERLELFVPVCQAIQHAHQKGVIHRDIKPNNVLVALYDDKPVPKVIDFGVAKAAGQTLTDKTLATGFGAVVGTPEYMSPEQASFNNLDIDTRSDVYALGVLLYELLAGSPPFSKKELEQAGLLEIFRVIREQEPPKPSTRLSTADALPTLSANRGTEPAKLTRLLRGELDWIVMKALEKDRSRRYETANGFAADVQRYLAGEPVQAAPPSTRYRVKKFLRRNKGPVLAAAVVFLALLVGIVGTTWGLVRADDARREEAEQRRTAERLKTESDTQRARAEEQQRLAEYRAASVTVDAALQYLATGDTREGLVRLAATLKTLPPDAVLLRQAVVTNLLVWGQRLAPPYPSIANRFYAVSPDGRVAIIPPAGKWEVRDLTTGRKVVALGDDNSAVFDIGLNEWNDWAVFSADGTRAATIDFPSGTNPTIRVWNTATWKEHIRLRPTNGLIHKVRLNRDAARVATLSQESPGAKSNEVETLPWTHEGPRLFRAKSNEVETVIHLWDGQTGRLVAKLDHGGVPAGLHGFSPNGDVLLTTSGPVARLWSAADGRLLHTLDRHAEEIIRAEFSPSGKWLAVAAGKRVYWWNVETGRPDGLPVEIAADIRPGDPDDVIRFAFSAEDVLIVRVWNLHGVSFGRRVGSAVCVRGQPRAYDLDAVCSDGRYALTDDGYVYALNPLRRLEAPAGHRFPPEVRAAASGRRFVQMGERLIDLESEKPIGVRLGGPDARIHPLSAPGCAFLVEGEWNYGRFSGQRLIPAPDLALPDDLLVLWARVVARGHLDPGSGLFVDDDETVWERNRQELVRRPVAVGEFPFPGPFAADRLFWLRQAWEDEKKAENQLLLIERLVAAEPSWQNYRKRAYALYLNKRYADAIRDDLKAREIGKEDYDDDNRTWANGGQSAVEEIIVVTGQPKEAYQLALTWIETVAPGRSDHAATSLTISRALALYRLGRYPDALRVVERFELQTVADIAGGLMSPFVALAAHQALIERRRDSHNHTMMRVIEALCHHQLGQPDKARQSLAKARAALRDELLSRPVELRGGLWGYDRVIGEALTSIEGPK